MAWARRLASQLRRPNGWLGSFVVSRVMNRVNARITDTTIALLNLQPHHIVLEIGFGGGHGLERLQDLVHTGKIHGIDFSDDVVRQAERRFRKQLAEGRLTLRHGDAMQLPYTDESFDRVLTINTVYFWPDTLRGLREILRVLKPGGCAAVAIRSREKMEKRAIAQHGFRLFEPAELALLMQQAGFREVNTEHQDRGRAWDQVIVLGTR